MYNIQITPRLLHFKQPAGTSRGVYNTRKVWYIEISSMENPSIKGIVSRAPLPNLSCDDVPQYEEVLQQACSRVAREGNIPTESLRNYPSILFGLETVCVIMKQEVWLYGTPVFHEAKRVFPSTD